MAKQPCVVKRLAKFTSTAPQVNLSVIDSSTGQSQHNMRRRAGIRDASRPIRCSSRETILIPHELASHWPSGDSNKVEAIALATALMTPPRQSLIGGTDSVLASDCATHRLCVSLCFYFRSNSELDYVLSERLGAESWRKPRLFLRQRCENYQKT